MFARRPRMNRRGIGSSGQALTGPLEPQQITSATLLAEYRTDTAVTLEVNMLETGTTPPNITLSGDLTQCLGLRITAGAVNGQGRGTDTLDISLDNGSTVAGNEVLTAATIDLDEATVGVDTGITLAYENAATNANNVWQAVADTLSDIRGSAHFTEAAASAANKPLAITSGDLSKPCLRFVAASSMRLNNSGTFANSFAGGSDLANEAWYVIDPIAMPGASGTYFFCASASGDSDPLYAHTISPNSTTPANAWRAQKIDAAGTGTSLVLSDISAVTGPAIVRYRHTGTQTYIYVNNTLLGWAASNPTGSQDVGTLGTLNQATIGSLRLASSFSGPWDGDFYHAIYFIGNLSPSDATGLYQWLAGL